MTTSDFNAEPDRRVPRQRRQGHRPVRARAARSCSRRPAPSRDSSARRRSCTRRTATTSSSSRRRAARRRTRPGTTTSSRIPRSTVELPGETFKARGRVTTGEERDRLFNAQADLMPGFDEYQYEDRPRDPGHRPRARLTLERGAVPAAPRSAAASYVVCRNSSSTASGSAAVRTAS